MACTKPLKAYQSRTKKTKNGKAYIAFKLEDAGLHYDLISLPCGQCIDCRLDRSKQWAIRCVHEASFYENNCFITLTFNDDSLNSKGTLIKSDFQKFMKRFRKKFKGVDYVRTDEGQKRFPIRYFHCGEYGTHFQRPHHHACIFNFDFADKVLFDVRKGVRLYTSETLEELWGHGFCTVGDLTFDSAAYVARYITKKVNGDQAASHYVEVDEETGEMFYLEPEYVTMSRRPGIGKRWFEQYHKTDCYNKDFITHDGKKFKPPAYYDKIYDLVNPADMEVIKKRRIDKASKIPWQEKTPSRLHIKEKCRKAKFKRLPRNLERNLQL